MKLEKNSFSDIRVLVVGDVMIDQYMWGKVYRNSPEADIPVLEEVKIEQKLGGAANVANNLKDLGADVFLLSIVGDDKGAEQITTLLAKSNIRHQLVTDKSRPTTVKTRIFKDSEQLIRVDQESTSEMSIEQDEIFLTNYQKAIAEFKPDILIMQDYNKGVLTQYNIPLLIKYAKEHSIFISVDPKKKNFALYQNVDLIKPNLKELYHQIRPQEEDIPFQPEWIAEEATKLLHKMSVGIFLVTLSEHGAMICSEKESTLKEADPIEIVDVCGAGDGVIAVATLMAHKGASNERILHYTNKTGRIVCQKTGVAGIAIDELLF